MINFFRKVRQKLLAEYKFSKYLIYAIGEIVLVVIGILIALQINNWNKNQKNRHEEIKILTALSTKLTESKKRIDKTIKYQSQVVNRGKSLSLLLSGKKDINSIDSIELIPQIFNGGALVFHRVEPVNATYDALTGAGKTVLIRNELLNKSLAKYSAEIKLGYEDHEYGMIINGIILEKTSSYNGPLLSNIKDHNKDELHDAVKALLNDKSIIGIVHKKKGIETRRLNWQKSLSKKVSKMIEIVNDELLKTKG